MWPTLFRVGPVEFGTFGLMAALGFVAAYLVFRVELKRRGLELKLGPDLLLAGVVGGLVGARVNFILEYRDVFVVDPLALIWSRYGFTWYGGVIGGALAYILVLKLKKQPIGPYADAVAPSLALGYVFGRVGCQLAGDGDYGVPSSLPWAMSYPRGIVPTLVRVHPTPVYEMLLTLATFFVLWRLRRVESRSWWLFGVYLALAGAARFGVEFVRTNPPVALGLTEAQWASAAVAATGIALVVARKGAGRRA